MSRSALIIRASSPAVIPCCTVMSWYAMNWLGPSLTGPATVVPIGFTRSSTMNFKPASAAASIASPIVEMYV